MALNTKIYELLFPSARLQKFYFLNNLALRINHSLRLNVRRALAPWYLNYAWLKLSNISPQIATAAWVYPMDNCFHWDSIQALRYYRETLYFRFVLLIPIRSASENVRRSKITFSLGGDTTVKITKRSSCKVVNVQDHRLIPCLKGIFCSQRLAIKKLFPVIFLRFRTVSQHIKYSRTIKA